MLTSTQMNRGSQITFRNRITENYMKKIHNTKFQSTKHQVTKERESFAFIHAGIAF